jgi:hypothetical protein
MKMLYLFLGFFFGIMSLFYYFDKNIALMISNILTGLMCLFMAADKFDED